MAHGNATKARVMALLMAGESVNATARMTGVPRTTVRRWRPTAHALLRDALLAGTDPKKGIRVGGHQLRFRRSQSDTSEGMS